MNQFSDGGAPVGDTRVHPVLGFARALETALGKVAGSDPVFMTAAEKEEALALLYAEEQRLAAVRMKVMAVGGDVAEVHASRDVADWLAHASHSNSASVHNDLQLAQDLERRWARLGEALASGRANLAQARVIAAALDDLPADLAPETLVQAEEHLVSLTDSYTPRQLRVLGRRILEVVAPVLAEAEEGRKLEEEERRARARTSLRFKRLGTGATRITLILPDKDAERLRTDLDAFTSPRQPQQECSTEPGAGQGVAGPATGVGLSDLDRIPADRLRGQAFCALLEHLDPRRLPDHGGDATHVMVTIGLDQLREHLAAAGIGPEERISATEARRLACTAKIIPAVLGGNGEILDLGRAQRLFSPAQRRAMALRDGRCRAEGCTIPATWCESHHLRPWSQGGNTDLDDGVLLCSWHHHRIHDRRYRHQRLPHGDYRFTRRT